MNVGSLVTLISKHETTTLGITKTLNAQLVHGFQQCFGFNVLAGNMVGRSIEPYFLPPSIPSEIYQYHDITKVFRI